MTPRAAAKLAGEPRYSTGKSCKHGHIALRLTSSGQCVECSRLAIHLWHSQNKENQKIRNAAWRKANPERAREHQRKHSEKKTLRGWKRQGLPTPTRARAERCEICNELPKKRALALDHCHETGIFRGWLCHRCNIAIGLFKDRPRFLLLAFQYLVNAHNLQYVLVEKVEPGSDPEFEEAVRKANAR